MTVKPSFPEQGQPVETRTDKWAAWRRYWTRKNPSDAEIARGVAADPDAAPIFSAEEMAARTYVARPPRRAN